MIDLHSHILPGLDDGAEKLEESRALARLAAAEGVTAIAGTPHVRTDYPTSAEQMELRVEELRSDFAEQGIGVEVLHGGEIAFDMLPRLDEDELRRFSLAQGGAYLLLEFPYRGWPLGLERTVRSLADSGMRAVLAHPERNHEVRADPGQLAEAVAAGALVQITAAALDGRLSSASREAAHRLLELGLAHVLASDAHTPDIREAGLSGAVEALEDERLARYLTVEAPSAIVAGAPVPEPPPVTKRRRGKRFIFF